MSEKRRIPGALCALFGFTAPLLLAHCGDTSGNADVQAGGAGQSGTMNAGATNAGATNGGSAGGVGEAGSGGTSVAGAPSADAGTGGASAGTAGGSACLEEQLTFSSPYAQHVAVCSMITYPMNPPVYGDHYPVWAAYKSYSFPVPLGFLVHNLEHGAVELLYNCPQGCADEVALAQTFLDALPMDPRCTPEVKHQTILSPDPTLPSRWAVVAWGHSLTSDCFDRAAFQIFYDANVAHGPEDICSDGADLTSDTCL